MNKLILPRFLSEKKGIEYRLVSVDLPPADRLYVGTRVLEHVGNVQVRARGVKLEPEWHIVGNDVDVPGFPRKYLACMVDDGRLYRVKMWRTEDCFADLRTRIERAGGSFASAFSKVYDELKAHKRVVTL
jgi:hypothetical protein